MYTCMRLTTPDGQFATANFFLTFSIFCKHTSKFTCDAIFSVPDRKNCCRKSDVWCHKSDSDTGEQRNINEKVWKIRCRKSAVGCCKPHTCVRTLREHSYSCLEIQNQILTKIPLKIPNIDIDVLWGGLSNGKNSPCVKIGFQCDWTFFFQLWSRYGKTIPIHPQF